MWGITPRVGTCVYIHNYIVHICIYIEGCLHTYMYIHIYIEIQIETEDTLGPVCSLGVLGPFLQGPCVSN